MAKRLSAMLLTVLFATTPSANALLIDGFGDGQGPIEANSTNPNPTNGQMAISDTDLTGAERTLELQWASGNGIELANGSAGSNVLAYSQDTLTTGTGGVHYSFDPVDMTQLARALYVHAVELDNGTNGTLEIIMLLTDGTNSTSVGKTYTANQENVAIGFSFADFTGIDLTAVTGASLTIDGSASSAADVSIDFIEVPVAEPATLSLFGAALLGLGVLARRRKRKPGS